MILVRPIALLLILADLVDQLVTALAQAHEALRYHRDASEVMLLVKNVMVFAQRQPVENCTIALC